jgi:hypothetical protein
MFEMIIAAIIGSLAGCVAGLLFWCVQRKSCDVVSKLETPTVLGEIEIEEPSWVLQGRIPGDLYIKEFLTKASKFDRKK